MRQESRGGRRTLSGRGVYRYYGKWTRSGASTLNDADVKSTRPLAARQQMQPPLCVNYSTKAAARTCGAGLFSAFRWLS